MALTAMTHTQLSQLPVVLVFAGLDPCGGAGIQADIEAIAAQGCHAASIVTCLTVQDTRNLYRSSPVNADLVRHQAQILCADVPIAAIKLGLLGSIAMVETVSAFLHEHKSHIPVICDPVLAAGGGQELATAHLLEVMREILLPQVSLLTPNSLEARRLAGCENLAEAAHKLCEFGCQQVLITGTHESSERVEHRCYNADGCFDVQSWERLPGEYHGSGCTLAASLAAQLAQGKPLVEALTQAQSYTWHTLQAAFQIGQGQAIPRRYSPVKSSAY